MLLNEGLLGPQLFEEGLQLLGPLLEEEGPKGPQLLGEELQLLLEESPKGPQLGEGPQEPLDMIALGNVTSSKTQS